MLPDAETYRAILDTLPSCLPTIIPVETVAPAAGELLRQQLANIPDTIVLENLVQATPESMQELKGRLQLTKGALQWSWLPILFLLIIGALAGGQTQDGVPRWLGWSLVAAGVLIFLLTFIMVIICQYFDNISLAGQILSIFYAIGRIAISRFLKGSFEFWGPSSGFLNWVVNATFFARTTEFFIGFVKFI